MSIAETDPYNPGASAKARRLALQLEMSVVSRDLAAAGQRYHTVLCQIVASETELARLGITDKTFLLQEPMPKDLIADVILPLRVIEL
jgi:hypothetical protein